LANNTVVSRGSCDRGRRGAHDRTRSPNDTGDAIELATREFVAASVRVTRGSDARRFEGRLSGDDSQVRHAVGYCGVRMRSDGDRCAGDEAGGGAESTFCAQRHTRCQEVYDAELTFS